ncbi:hypothetical protein [Streptomyces sp. NPDC023588]
MGESKSGPRPGDGKGSGRGHRAAKGLPRADGKGSATATAP